MIIRRAETKDKARLGQLLSQVLLVHHNARPDLFKSGAKKYTDAELDVILADDTRPIFVAERDGEVLGYAFCIFIQHKDNNILTDVKTLYIDDLCVDENIRGKGIGRSLYNYVVEYAKECGCYNVTLNVWADNKPALAFYESIVLHKQKIGMELILK
ncbi:MAG: GNAT family N-acetyltransferase [Clostridia bacterium]|nr:GNAT family N-acetyltransferase [Clostridia bacterium]